MTKKRNSITDLRGAGRLAIDAVNGVIDIVEAMHYNITSLGGILGNKKKRPSGITGLVYKNIRSITGIAGKGFDVLLGKLSVIVNEKEPTPEQEALLAALNGVIGDHLLKTNNPLAIHMHLRKNGKPLTSESPFFTDAVEAGKKIVLLIHGSCMNDLQWNRKGHDHGAALAEDFGYQTVYLHYNSGRHISENGKELSDLLDSAFGKIPVENELVILTHSMGGLVARSAWHYGLQASHKWLKRVKKIIFLGTPHHGSPLEQTGNWIDTMLASNTYSAPIAKLGKLRSAGVTDMRYGNIIDEDWNRNDRFEPLGDQRTPVPLPIDVDCFAAAAVISDVSTSLRDEVIGDGLVPLYSALGRHENPAFNLNFPEDHVFIVRNAKHLDLLQHPEIYSCIKKWVQ
ncbi:MAG: alpha/beta hydrolase [Cyclobacteriaceae bacterium]|nr:alpha/beta hydrolase [Cyclobacteriaceae bacterium]